MRKRLVLAVMAMSLVFVSPVDAQTALEQARDDVSAATAALEGYLADLEATQQRGDELARQYWQVQSNVQALDIEIAESEAATAELASRREGLRDEVRVIALDQYVSRSEELGVGDHDSEADRAAAETLARLVVGADNDAIDQLAVVDERYLQTRTELRDQRAEQTEALAIVEQTQRSITDELERLAQLRRSLDAELVELEQALAALEEAEAERQAAAAERERIAAERQRAEEAAAAAAALARAAPTPAPTPTLVPTPVPTATAVPNPQPSVPISGGGIVCPLAGPFTHTDDFNAPRAVGGVHRANDLISAQGTPVLAVASGSVDHRNSSVGGMSVHLKGDNGDYYFYTHLSGYENVGAGHVSAGTVVGYVGMTGNAPIPHLHFEIHKGGYGNYSNPYGPVRNACF